MLELATANGFYDPDQMVRFFVRVLLSLAKAKRFGKHVGTTSDVSTNPLLKCRLLPLTELQGQGELRPSKHRQQAVG
jgi:hypothetical protein